MKCVKILKLNYKFEIGNKCSSYDKLNVKIWALS